MKVILVGSSGFIGGEVLRQCLAHPAITSLVALSRRELPVTDARLKTVLVQDWLNFGPEVLRECEGAEACIWSLGVKTMDVAIQKTVSIDYTIAGATALSALSSAPLTRPRFIFASGILAVRDASKSAWFGSGARHAKGEAEAQLLALSAQRGSGAGTGVDAAAASSSAPVLDAFIMRPGAVLEGAAGGLVRVAGGLGAPVVELRALAAVMVELALGGPPKGAGAGAGSAVVAEEGRVWENRELVRWGAELLEAR